MIYRLLIAFFLILTPLSWTDASGTQISQTQVSETQENNQEIKFEKKEQRRIRNIIIKGNSYVPEETILPKIPYKSGEIFDKSKTGKLIRNLWDLGYFNRIQVFIDPISETQLDLHVVLGVKKKLAEITFEGNNNLKDKEIEKLDLKNIAAVDEQELEEMSFKIKNLYAEKNYHDVQITAELIPITDTAAKVHFKIKEGKKSVVKRVFFKGNKHISSKVLGGLIFTREDWILSILDKAGTYSPDMLDLDRHRLANYYQSQGYLTANVKDVDIKKDPKTSELVITFDIEEGDLFTVKNISIPGNDILSEQQLKMMIPICPGELYSKEKLFKAIEQLKLIWGEYGYIYADVDPQILPDFDEKTVDITLNTDLGNKIQLRRINIIGNQKTRDFVIRRHLVIDEGETITNRKMELSKNRVEGLGFFDPKEGVNWKIKKVDDNLADLDLILKEIKTGQVMAQIGTNGIPQDATSPSTSFNITAFVRERNLMGTGMQFSVGATYSRQDFTTWLNISQPWLCNRPIYFGLDVSHKRANYEDYKETVDNIPVEKITGAGITLGYTSPRLYDTSFLFNTNYENVDYNRIIAKPPRTQLSIDRQFQSGDLFTAAYIMSQSLFNNPAYPTRGYAWAITGKVGSSLLRNNFGFFKFEADASWVTPLINEYDLVFFLHGHAGFVHQFNNKCCIPYRELFHVGGPATVRGYLFGEIGPNIKGDSIGATKAFWINAELRFPITKDLSIKGAIFYDGGAGWDTLPSLLTGQELLVRNNQFNFRQSVGVGLRLTNPSPVRIDVGFKLNRNRRLKESPYEVHFTMNQEF
ncbi:outer membrane protein assembly factor BamA [Candidatus Dependentiae bacterium]|nr:outer membrane protein assembly factor BamA [Candidatus Dependentiae bacterium]